MKSAVLILALLAGCASATGPAGTPPSEERMAAVRAGMTPAEVEQILGRPTGGTATYGAGEHSETVSGWSLPTRGRVRAEYFNVHYLGGKVVRTSRSAEYPD